MQGTGSLRGGGGGSRSPPPSQRRGSKERDCVCGGGVTGWSSDWDVK